MGDPKRKHKKYSTPMHPWQKDRIEIEKQLIEEFGLKNKTEIWKFESELRRFKAQAKKLILAITEQAKKEEQQLKTKLYKYSLINKDARIEDILAIDPKMMLERRLQTIVYKKGLARTIKQARQLIAHGHIFVENKKVDVPSYLVSRDEEVKISFNPKSSISKEDHPERIIKKKAEKKEKKEEKKPKKKRVVKKNG